MKLKRLALIGIASTMLFAGAGLAAMEMNSGTEVSAEGENKVERTVYCLIDNSKLENGRKLKLNIKVASTTWVTFDTASCETAAPEKKSLFAFSMYDLWDGCDVMQFQIYDGSNKWETQVEAFNAYTKPSVYENKVFDYEENTWKSVNTYTYHFAGTSIETKVVNGTSISYEPKKDGYVFVGTEPEVPALVSKDMTFSVKWLKGDQKIQKSLGFAYQDSNRVFDSGYVYFTNNWSWRTVNCYAFDDKGNENAKWPGVAMKDVGKNSDGHTVYRANVAGYKSVIFNGVGENRDEYNYNYNYNYKTEDILLDSSSSAYYVDKWSENNNGKVTAGKWDKTTRMTTNVSLKLRYRVPAEETLHSEGVSIDGYRLQLYIDDKHSAITGLLDPSNASAAQDVTAHESTDMEARLFAVVSGKDYLVGRETNVSAKKVAQSYLASEDPAIQKAISGYEDYLTYITTL